MFLTRLRTIGAVVIGAVLLLTAVALQIRMGSVTWSNDLTGMDEAGHYATGVMVYEYLRHGLFSNPMAFAQDFYFRFPKVAFGHWPPVYYVLQSAIYPIVGPSIRSARILSFLVCTCCAATLFVRLRRVHGAFVAILTAACFLALPLVQLSSSLVMADLLVALFMLLAALAFVDFMDSARARDGALLVLWSTLAILTKGSGWALGILMVLAPLVAGQYECFRRRWFWLSGIAIVLVSAPFYFLMRALQVSYPIRPDHLFSASSMATRIRGSIAILHAAPFAVLVVALCGVVVSLGFRRNRKLETVAIALILSQILFQFFLPFIQETRYYLPSILAGMLLFARCLSYAGGVARPLAITAVCIFVGAMPMGLRLHGYRPAVDSIPYPSHGTVILIGSDPIGEGAFISERLEHGPSLPGVILRGSKVLASETWEGENYRLVVHDADAMLRYLDSIPVEYVVIDRSAPPIPHVKLLDAAVQSAPDKFVLAGEYPISGFRHGEISVYRNVHAQGREAETATAFRRCISSFSR